MYVATVLTVYGIETFNILFSVSIHNDTVATVLTVYGIETDLHHCDGVSLISCNSTYRLRY